jgi:electron transfer flavoprotein alpha subunit
MSKKQVWVFIENTPNGIADVSKELISEATRLSDKLNGEVCGIILGEKAESAAQELFDMRCDKVYAVSHKELADFRALPYTANIANAIEKYKPYIVLFGATSIGRELGPRVASSVKCGLTADCTELKIGDYTMPANKKEFKDLLLQIRPAFGGNIIATIVNPEMHPQMATVRPGVMKMEEPLKKGSGKGELITLEPVINKEDLVTEIIEKIQGEKKVNLSGAQIIVAGGMGVGSRENFELVKELARTLGGEVGASRAAVDAGWIDHDHQVGQTGITVRPKLYIACGISGSVQHIAGMMESKQIIAINNDPNADIMKIANYKIVGDLNQILPMMIKAYREKA